jgi:predicted DNA-binding antitoxin AbrB/MazE fold protein
MAGTVVEAVYENGVLRLARPIDLAEGTRVDVVVTPSPVERPDLSQVVERPDPGQVNVILDRLAALAQSESESTHVGRDHDAHLYGERGVR